MEMLELEVVGAEADFGAIHALLMQCFAYMDGRIDPPSSLHRLSAEDLAAKAEKNACVIARLEGHLVGCLFVEDLGDALAIEKLAVHPDCRRAGIASGLIEGASMIAQSLGRQKLRLQTRIELTENHAAFAAMGFTRTGKTAHPGFDRPTSVTMEKRL